MLGGPIVTMPLPLTVGSQTYAILSSIGLHEFVAADPENYIRMARELARDHGRLASLRSQMLASSLMDITGFTRRLEDCFVDLFRNVSSEG
jgi:protein O-GlcNAc transferase